MNWYDDELIAYLHTIEVKDFALLKQADDVCNLITKNFPFKYDRVNFTDLKNERYIQSDCSSLSNDAVSFLKELIQEHFCKPDEKVIYVGDLPEYGYEFRLNDLLKIIPYLVNDIPLGHYFLFGDTTKLMYVSPEEEIQFGMQSEHDLNNRISSPELSVRCKNGLYHSFFDFTLDSSERMLSNDVQLNKANRAFIVKMNTDATFRQNMFRRYPELSDWLKNPGMSCNPGGRGILIWHHRNSEREKLELVDFRDYNENYKIYHPDSEGGVIEV